MLIQGCEYTSHMYMQEVCICAPLSLQGAQMPRSHWAGRGLNLLPPTPPRPPAVPLAHTPVSLPCPLWVSLYFSNSLCIGAGREHLIFIIWFREGPEALSHGMVSMETDLLRGLGVSRRWWGRRETYSKNPGSTSVVGVGPTPFMGSRERPGKPLGVLVGGAASPHPLGLPPHPGS